MATGQKINKVEKAKRIRIIMEWLLDDWIAGDIISQIVTKWGVTERQAFRYLSEARQNWNKDETVVIDTKRRQKIQTLHRLKRTLKENYKGTPAGIRAILSVEKEIIQLENLRPATKIQLSGDRDNPVQTEATIKSQLNNLSDDELMEKILTIQRKASDE